MYAGALMGFGALSNFLCFYFGPALECSIRRIQGFFCSAWHWNIWTVFDAGWDAAQSGKGWDSGAHCSVSASKYQRAQGEDWRPDVHLPGRLLQLPTEGVSVPGAPRERPLARNGPGRNLLRSPAAPRRPDYSLHLHEPHQIPSADAEAEVQVQPAHTGVGAEHLGSPSQVLLRPAEVPHNSSAGWDARQAGGGSGEAGRKRELDPERDPEPDFMETLALNHQNLLNSQ